ncbi:hypothetical protein U0070_023831 [Myodes glareolus]|uniref:Secreted protein n=1 Tax=Myodes glareolus TaxID=447135 RepID=A0AAW0HTX0_MYOGA
MRKSGPTLPTAMLSTAFLGSVSTQQHENSGPRFQFEGKASKAAAAAGSLLLAGPQLHGSPQCCEKDQLGRGLPLTFLCHSWVKGLCQCYVRHEWLVRYCHWDPQPQNTVFLFSVPPPGAWASFRTLP